MLMVGNFLSSSGFPPSTCEILAGKLKKCGVNVISTSDKVGRAQRLLDMLCTAVKYRKKYDAAYVEVYSGLAFIWAEMVCLALRVLGKNFVLSLHGGNLPDFGKRHPGRLRRLLNSAQTVVAPSQYLVKELSFCERNIKIIPNGIDISKYKYTPLKEVQPEISWLRAFHEIYNPCMAVEVAAGLSHAFPGIHLRMAGPDKDGTLAKVQEAAKRLKVMDRISFPGKIPKEQVPIFLQEGSIFINTTNVDNTPVSVTEAMASGKCIVSTNVGGLPFLLEDGKDALLTPSGDAEAMASTIAGLLDDPGLAKRISRNARKKAEKFDWGAVLPQWMTLFRSAANLGGNG